MAEINYPKIGNRVVAKVLEMKNTLGSIFSWISTILSINI